MKIALIGATGFVGSAILKEALGRGHEVTAMRAVGEQTVLRRLAQEGRLQEQTGREVVIARIDYTEDLWSH